MTLGNLGNASAELRRFEEAIACYQQDIMICREVGYRYGEGRNLDNLASFTRRCGGVTRRRGAGGRRRRCVMPVTMRRPGSWSSGPRELSSGGAAGGGAVTTPQGSRGGPPGWMISAMPMVPGRRLQGVAAALEAAGSWFGVVP